MAFTFTNYAGIAPQTPLKDLVSKAFNSYGQGIKAKYMPQQIEADIFNKQISPLAMLASSPFFSSLHPEQQQQIAGYISQMLNKQGMGSPQSGQGGGFQAGGGGNNLALNGATSQGIPQQQGNNPQGEESLIPNNPGEHFTGKFTQSPYSAGTAHRGSQGQTVYAPTGSNVQKGIDIITESKGLKNLFDQYAALAPDVGGAGGFKRDLSNVASGISKTGLPYSDKISNFLGGAKLSNEAAKAESLRAQMAPALRAIGFKDHEIGELLRYYPGEDAKNIKDRLAKTWPVIERKIKTHEKNLKTGININPNDINQKIGQKIAQSSNNSEFKEPPQGTIGLYRKGKLYYIPPDKVDEALAEGFTYE